MQKILVVEPPAHNAGNVTHFNAMNSRKTWGGTDFCQCNLKRDESKLGFSSGI